MIPLKKTDVDVSEFITQTLKNPDYPLRFDQVTLKMWEVLLRYDIESEMPHHESLRGDDLLRLWIDNINHKFVVMYTWQTVQRHLGYTSTIDPVRAAGLKTGNVPYPRKMKKWLREYWTKNEEGIRNVMVSDRKIRDHLADVLHEKFPFEKTPDGRTVADWMRDFGGVYQKKSDGK